MAEFLNVSALAVVWYMLKATPGVVQSLGYVFGFLLATWAFDEYL
jgi:hypothetical protein